jgi:hypothetical protein
MLCTSHLRHRQRSCHEARSELAASSRRVFAACATRDSDKPIARGRSHRALRVPSSREPILLRRESGLIRRISHQQTSTTLTPLWPSRLQTHQTWTPRRQSDPLFLPTNACEQGIRQTSEDSVTPPAVNSFLAVPTIYLWSRHPCNRECSHAVTTNAIVVTT